MLCYWLNKLLYYYKRKQDGSYKKGKGKDEFHPKTGHEGPER